MIVVNPSVSLVGANVKPYDLLKHVELCGRVCYKSENRITDDSAGKFIANVIKRGHEAVIEHGRITMELINVHSIALFERISNAFIWTGNEDYLVKDKVMFDETPLMTHGIIISGNIRAWRVLAKFALDRRYEIPREILRMMHDNAPFFPEFSTWDYGSDYFRNTVKSPDSYADTAIRQRHSWYTLRFVCDRGISHEIVRHRPASYCQESTRYCNYSKGDFNGQITVIQPCFLEPGTLSYQHWEDACKTAEAAYFDLLNDGCTPQQARDVLPNSLKTELVMTATGQEWLHFLNLRTAEAAHPQMREVATQVKEILRKNDPEVFSDESIRNA